MSLYENTEEYLHNYMTLQQSKICNIGVKNPKELIIKGKIKTGYHNNQDGSLSDLMKKNTKKQRK